EPPHAVRWKISAHSPLIFPRCGAARENSPHAAPGKDRAAADNGGPRLMPHPEGEAADRSRGSPPRAPAPRGGMSPPPADEMRGRERRPRSRLLVRPHAAPQPVPQRGSPCPATRGCRQASLRAAPLFAPPFGLAAPTGSTRRRQIGEAAETARRAPPPPQGCRAHLYIMHYSSISYASFLITR